MNSEEIESQQDEELSAADEVEEEADEVEEEDLEEEEPRTAAELLHEAAVRILQSPVYSPDPPLEITEEDIAEIPDIPSPGRAAFFISAAEQNLHLTALQGKAARHMEKLKYLQEANRAKRCEHVKADGESCAGPALRGQQYCRFHVQSYTELLVLPIVEDRRSLQLAFSQLVRATAAAQVTLSEAKVLMQILDKAGRYLPEEKPERWDEPRMP